MKRIDKDGNYTTFPGVTVIAAIGNNATPFWQKVYDFLVHSKAISEHYKPLPCTSYHMTTCNLYTKEQYPDDWPSYVTKQLNFLQKLHAKLSETPLTPEISIDDISIPDVLQLYVSLPTEQEELIRAIAREFGLEDNVPKGFHITLAYEYNPIIEQEDYDAIKRECEKLLKFCKEEGRLTLDCPQLSYFTSMENFIPWDGKTNPFIAQGANDSCFFSLRRLGCPELVNTISSYFSSKFF
ncbi:DUF1868 domain-containing protein [Legionella maceachernii]|uniref:DUF1868 domain-containing protein n=1 Tax=Legionella maceachernii TaxID=466 RepID=A0A0W0VY78_9GAMM|nr:DUF1868 domain-containing protein [Legionella maceachernii]KTD25109.1 hypothetical protein Lmac_2087 [Legionella maceachernii]SKA28805.1 hypothetical protein SAMN02745128_03060 [Legionella maceachernii]SUP02497.1 Uncharacterized protein conserved in bacteria [Legionella maceachernii]